MTTLVIDYYKKWLTSGVSGGYDFVDVAEGIITCCKKGKIGDCYILSNEYFIMKEILFMLYEITDKKEIKSFLHLWFVKSTAPLAEIYYNILKQPPLFTAYSIYTLNTNAVFFHEKATEELGYTTRNMKQTLTDTVDCLKEIQRL